MITNLVELRSASKSIASDMSRVALHEGRWCDVLVRRGVPWLGACGDGILAHFHSRHYAVTSPRRKTGKESKGRVARSSLFFTRCRVEGHAMNFLAMSNLDFDNSG